MHTPNPPGIKGVKWCMPPIENDENEVMHKYPKEDAYLKKVKKKTSFRQLQEGAPVVPMMHPPNRNPPGIIGVNGWRILPELQNTSIFQNKMLDWMVRRHSYFRRHFYMVLWRTIATAYVHITSIMVHMVVWMAMGLLLTEYG